MLNVELIVEDGQGSSPKQSSDLRSVVSGGVDGIVLDPNDANALTPAVKETMDVGIPAVSFDRYVASAKTAIPFFCLDNVAGPAAPAKYVVNKFRGWRTNRILPPGAPLSIIAKEYTKP